MAPDFEQKCPGINSLDAGPGHLPLSGGLHPVSSSSPKFQSLYTHWHFPQKCPLNGTWKTSSLFVPVEDLESLQSCLSSPMCLLSTDREG